MKDCIEMSAEELIKILLRRENVKILPDMDGPVDIIEIDGILETVEASTRMWRSNDLYGLVKCIAQNYSMVSVYKLFLDESQSTFFIRGYFLQ